MVKFYLKVICVIYMPVIYLAKKPEIPGLVIYSALFAMKSVICALG